LKSSYNSHVKRIAAGLVAAAVMGFLFTRLLVPESFGVHGHYRADAIGEEAAREIRHWTNAPCFTCHAYEANVHLNGLHKNISCEFCHGPYADHVKDGKKTGPLPVRKGDDINTLCLRCHNKAIQARPEEVIKTVTMPEHLFNQRVRLTHLCNQCHHVHAPLKYIKRANEIVGMLEEK